MNKMLNLGSGTDLRAGWTNLDQHSQNYIKWLTENEYYANNLPEGTVFVKHKLPDRMPFNDNNFDFVFCSHLLEDFSNQDFLKILKDILRVLKVGGTVEIRVPEYGYNGALANPFHQKLFQKNSFEWFAKDGEALNDYEEDERIFSKMLSCKSVTRQSWLSHVLSETYKFLFPQNKLSGRTSIKNQSGILWKIYCFTNLFPPFYDKEIRVVFKK